MKVRGTRRRRDVPAQSDHRDPVSAFEAESMLVAVERAERLRSDRDGARPAFYALERGGWCDYLTLLHPPYTLWHLSYVVLGAALSPTLRYDRLAATLLAFFLAVGVSAHALDELNGRPLRTRISGTMLIALGAVGLAGAVAIGIAGAIFASPWLLAFVAFGVFIAPAYSLEWFGGRFHSGFWFALGWGVFPFVTAYWASAERFEMSVLFGAAAIFALSLAQRTLSLRVRVVRRQVRSIEGRIVYADGSVADIDHQWALATNERALMLMAAAVFSVALAALAART